MAADAGEGWAGMKLGDGHHGTVCGLKKFHSRAGAAEVVARNTTVQFAVAPRRTVEAFEYCL